MIGTTERIVGSCNDYEIFTTFTVIRLTPLERLRLFLTGVVVLQTRGRECCVPALVSEADVPAARVTIQSSDLT